jgi:hypothetical protein
MCGGEKNGGVYGFKLTNDSETAPALTADSLPNLPLKGGFVGDIGFVGARASIKTSTFSRVSALQLALSCTITYKNAENRNLRF